ncbi:DUF3500 domain-containing protein [Solicola sp. PLA-1-18]|uniref:DUF3500 domain-containing protein n=1 Tax=Solicola sp. PLA-1-18 TaxID=3380532 RepID=UPI003B79EC6F
MDAYAAPRTAQRLLVIMIGLLDTMDAQQRSVVVMPFDDQRRTDWDIIPRPDPSGLALHFFDRHQRVLIQELLAAALTTRTYTKTLAIRQLEHVLRAEEADFLGPAAQTWRTSDSYRLAVFGRPGFEDTWGFRFLGHHVCINITVVQERWISATPSALGQQPVDYDGVLRPLADDESLGFELLGCLDDDQRAAAIVHDVAPADFVTRQVPHVGAFEYPDYYDLGMPQYTITAADRVALKLVRDSPTGVGADRLGTEQQAILDRLVDTFLHRHPAETQEHHRAAYVATPRSEVHFAWAGGTTRGTPHYFRVQTPTFLIELVNAVNSGQHIHSVLRDLDNDFGHNLLTAAAAADDHHLLTRTTSSADLDPGLE